MTAATQEYVTQEELKGLAARWLVGWILGAVFTGACLLIWAVRLEAKVDAIAARVEEVRTEGSVPLQSLRRDLDSLRIEMRALAGELRSAREQLRWTR